MVTSTSRLAGLVALAAFLLPGCGNSGSSPAADFSSLINTLEEEVGGAIGVYALDTGSGRELAFRANERFAMASTFKPLLVAAVLYRVDAGELALDDAVSLDGVTIQSYSPAIETLDGADSMSIAALCEAAITLGDNTATNLLLDKTGGPKGLTAFLREHGDTVTRLDRYEVALNDNERGDERDTTTPKAMAQSLNRFLFADVLSDNSRKQLQQWLIASQTGMGRLRAGLPESWQVGDKTGTGAHGAVNNVAVAWPPEHAPLLIVVYQSWSGKDMKTLDGVHRKIAGVVAREFATE